MLVNADKPHKWKNDIARSIVFYNDWFLNFAPSTYRITREKTKLDVIDSFNKTNNLLDLSPQVLRKHPEVLPILRMSTAPPIARDRLIGLSATPPTLIKSMEDTENPRIPPRMDLHIIDTTLNNIKETILKLVDKDLLPWIEDHKTPSDEEINRAAIVIADRLCGAISDPIIRNAQERRQLATLKEWLCTRGYKHIPPGSNIQFPNLKRGTFIFRLNVPTNQDNNHRVNIPIDIAIMPKNADNDAYPLLIEAKSAGDFTNTNKRRKEEAQKINMLRNTYGEKISFILFLCGYFDSGYLGYEAAEGIDWIWEHNVDELSYFIS